jgi:hypothetical protein
LDEIVRTFKLKSEPDDKASVRSKAISVEDMHMGAYHDPAFSGPIFPHGSRDSAYQAPRRLRGTIVSIQPGRRGKEKTQILTIKLDDLAREPQDLLHTSVELVVQPRPALRSKR